MGPDASKQFFFEADVWDSFLVQTYFLRIIAIDYIVWLTYTDEIRNKVLSYFYAKMVNEHIEFLNGYYLNRYSLDLYSLKSGLIWTGFSTLAITFNKFLDKEGFYYEMLSRKSIYETFHSVEKIIKEIDNNQRGISAIISRKINRGSQQYDFYGSHFLKDSY